MIGTKFCSICQREKPLSEFYRRSTAKDGHMSECKQCNDKRAKARYKKHKKEIQQKHREYYEKNREEISRKGKEYRQKNQKNIKERGKIYREKNRDEIRARAKQRRLNNLEEARRKEREYYRKNKDKAHKWHKKYRETHKEQIQAAAKRYRAKNRDRINLARIHRLHTDPVFKMKEQTRNMIRYALRSKGHKKTSATKDILGCDLNDLFPYLTKTWEDRYGQKWHGEPYHIDHITPLATANSKEEIEKLCHYTNLQMLTPEDNMNKSDRLDWQH